MVNLATNFSIDADDSYEQTENGDPLSLAKRGRNFPIFVKPHEFRMKFLNRILHVDRKSNKNGLVRLRNETNGGRTLHTSLVLENGDVGTLLTWEEEDSDTFTLREHKLTIGASRERLDSIGRERLTGVGRERLNSINAPRERHNSSSRSRERLNSQSSSDERDGHYGVKLPVLLPVGSSMDNEEKRARPLRLPPIQLPPIYKTRERQLRHRDFSLPSAMKAPMSDREWDELQDCRYLRHGLKKFRGSNLCRS